MNDQRDAEILKTRFLETWETDVPVVLPGEPDIDEPDTVWAKFTVNHTETRPRSISPVSYESIGRVFLQVFVPEGMGDAIGLELRDQFKAAFINWRSDDFVLRVGLSADQSRNYNTEGFITYVASIPYRST